METVSDPVFGEMTYNYSWEKRQDVLLWGTADNLRIVADAYPGEEITEAQRKGYSLFLDNIDRYSTKSLELAAEYVSRAYESIDASKVGSLMAPTAILFKQDGTFGILCNFEYDEEHGLAIILSPEDKEQAGPQDIFI